MSKARADALIVLELTVHFPPNTGGVETHLGDLVAVLSKKGWKIFVLCYRPLSTKINWKIYEKVKKIEILRLPWLAGLFYKFIPYPKLEFLYLFPGLFIFTPIVLLARKTKIIHAHGLVAATVAVFWGKLFAVDTIVSTHSLYNFPNTGLYRSFAKLILGNAKEVLCLSKKSLEEIKILGIKKTKRFTYWIDFEKFKKIDDAKKKLGWDNKFTVLFVGRLVSEKGIKVLLNSLRKWNVRINLVFVGNGPLEKEINKASSKLSSIKYMRRVSQEDLPTIYSAADCLIVPSTSEEGFGRVIIESLACQTPVIASNRGAISEVMDDSVGLLIDVNEKNIKNAVEYLFKHPSKLKILAKNSRKFAERRYSEKNAEQIIKTYAA